MNFRNYACWKAEDAVAILRTEALESSRAVFMAVHSPIRDFRVEGMLGGLLDDEKSETGLLDALTGPDHRHVFCVVQGEHGSGKSHLIRWLRFNWETRREQDLVLMVPRSNGSLEGALRHLKERLPESYQHLFAGLGQVQDTTLQGRARDFHSKLANSLGPNYFSGEAPQHAEWAEQYQLSRLIGHHEVLEQWSAPRRILETLSGGSDRNSRVESFTLRDVHELALLLRSVRDRTVGPKALQARRKFERESALLGPLLDRAPDGSVDEIAAAEVAPMLVRLREALDARFNTVVQDLVGVGRDGLVRAFRQLRKHLAAGGQRLVLLLEDITSFQGVDKQLLDVLVAKSETEEDDGELCDLLSVVGITTDFFDQSMRGYGNLRERISLHVYLGDATAGRSSQSLSLTDAGGRQRFASHYLRAVRAGIGTIERWAQSGHGELTNACVGCPHHGPCHRAFGSSDDGVGFYPLSPRAIDRIFESLLDPESTMSLRTPRGMVQNVLSPMLLHPERLEKGQYPPPNLEGANLPKEEGYLLGQVERIPTAMLVDLADRERMRRFIAWWSSTNPGAQMRRDAEGRLLFAEIAKEAYEAFDLPWPGEDVEAGAGEPEISGSVDTESNELADVDQLPEADAPKPLPRARPKPPPANVGKSTATPEKVSRTQMDKLRAELKGWFEGARVREDKHWSLLLMEVLDTLPWRSLGVPHWLQQRLFTDSTVMLEGTRRSSVRHFVVPRADWVREGLDGWLALRTQSGEEVEYHRRRVARFLRRLNRLVLAHVESKSLAAPEGGVWNPAGTAAQALLARAWLQGRLPDVSLAKRWETILVQDQGTGLSAAGHTPGWREVVERVGNYLSNFRQFVRAWVQLTLTPEKGDDGIVDAGAVAHALVAFDQRLELELPPDKPDLPQQLIEWVAIADVGRTVRKVMPPLARHEFNRVKRHLEVIEFACDRRSLSQYIEDVGQTIEQLRRTDTRAPQARIEEWHRFRRVLKDKDLLDARDGSRLRKLDDFLGDTDLEAREQLEKAGPIAQVAWILSIPYDDLALMAAEVGTVHGVLEQLWSYVSTLLEESPGDGSDPRALEAAGTRLVSAAEQITRVLPSEGKS